MTYALKPKWPRTGIAEISLADILLFAKLHTHKLMLAHCWGGGQMIKQS